jgi:hypothetical protein
MDYGRFVKKLAFPSGFMAPTELLCEDVVATAITRSHLQDDVAGINAVLAALLLERRAAADACLNQ